MNNNELFITQKCQSWIKTLGKEKIQAFQDSFAELFNISLCLLSLEGKALTVWSNSSLLCHYMLKNNRARCIQERQNVINKVFKKHETQIFTCYLGLTFFCCPVFCNEEIIGVFYGGAVCLEENHKFLDKKIKFDIPVISQRRIIDVIQLLENSIKLLNLKDNNLDTHAPKSNTIEEFTFLQKKLSSRQLEIVKLVSCGLTNKEIAEQLHISEKTVKTHVSNILRKLEMKDRMQIVLLCKQNNIV
ncbi:MAG: two-component system, NarL family, response regulator [Clostridia bacterium]|nr:two-component system, NarL family, response regulator [Clostridia bacterium]MDN5322340.1 two-component system, NarL family, response regulator [Clostridia bacterium]